MTELYNGAYAKAQRQAYGKWKLICISAAVSALAVSVVLCFFVSTGTARSLFYAVTAISVVTGWAYILFLRPSRKNALHQYAHCMTMLKKTETESEIITGSVRVSPYEVQIPGSIRVRTVKLTNAKGERTLHLNARFTLPEGRNALTLRCVGNYICAYEVTRDA